MQTIQDSLRRHRNEIKGFAILWVVFFHARLNLSGVLFDVQRIGYGGVDIFFFLSGFGLYHSLEFNNDLKSYIKRRIFRLMPAYLPFCLIWLLVMIPVSGVGKTGAVRMAMGNLFMVGFFSGSPLKINWYLSALLLSLLLAPFFHAFLGKGKRLGARGAILLVLLFCFGLAFIDNDAYMAISRLPVFVLGMLFAGWTYERPSKKTLAICLTCAFVAGIVVLYTTFDRFGELLITYAMFWHPFFLITPALCVGLAWLFSHTPEGLRKLFSFVGISSFEIFLFNAWLDGTGFASAPLQSLFWSLASIAAGLLYHLVVKKTVQIFSKKAEKRG